jgi:hypothetical protein
MTEIGFDSDSFGVPASDDHCADVCGPGAGYAVPSMMRRKFLGQTATKIVRLADIYRIPATIRPFLAEDVDAANLVERHTDCVVLEFVSRPARASPNDAREGID